MLAHGRHFFEFDAFRVEVEERRLLRKGKAIAVTAKAFDILLTLVENSGATVSKNDLLQAVWHDTFVEEGNLNHHISTLRRVLGDSLKEQRYIKTIPKCGYRFTAKVREFEVLDESLSLSSVSKASFVMRQETVEGFWNIPRAVIASGVAGVVIAVGAWAFSGPKADAQAVTPKPDAVESYTKGRELWRDRTAESLHEATLLLEDAVSADPGFALAYAALADAYAFDYANWIKAEAAARRAIELDPNLGEPHASIGFIKLFWRWDRDGAKDELRRAIDLSPDYATGHQWYAMALASMGQNDAALVEIGKALAIEPSSFAIIKDQCQLLYFAERYDEAAVQCEKALEMQPHSAAASELLFQIAMTRGDYNDAVRRFVQNLLASKNDRFRSQAAIVEQAYAVGGINGFRRSQMAFYLDIESSYYKAARVLGEAGDNDAAIDMLKKSAEKREFEYIFLASDPPLKQVRSSATRRFELRIPLLDQR